MFRRQIERAATGEILVRLEAEERALLRDVAEELSEALRDSPEDPSFRRLFPRAYDDDELEREFRELTGGQLAGSRERAAAVLRDTAGQDTLSADEADAWLRALNDARLVLGTRLDMTEDFDWEAFDARHPRAPELALYAYLSGLQEQLVDAVA